MYMYLAAHSTHNTHVTTHVYMHSKQMRVFEMNNGCICCTVKCVCVYKHDRFE